MKAVLKRFIVLAHSYGLLSAAAVTWAFRRYGLRYA